MQMIIKYPQQNLHFLQDSPYIHYQKLGTVLALLPVTVTRLLLKLHLMMNYQMEINLTEFNYPFPPPTPPAPSQLTPNPLTNLSTQIPNQ